MYYLEMEETINGLMNMRQYPEVMDETDVAMVDESFIETGPYDINAAELVQSAVIEDRLGDNGLSGKFLAYKRSFPVVKQRIQYLIYISYL